MSPEELFATAAPSVVRVEVRDAGLRLIGFGSAFFVSSDGLLVTNYHVIEKAMFASVRLGNKTTLFVDGIASINPDADLALLKVNVKNQAYLTLDSGQPPNVGVKVYAIGNPQGLENTFSDGMVSGYREYKAGVKIMQISVPISHGSSGGPLLTGDGKVVGVTTSGLVTGQNLNFAIQAAQVAELVRKKGKLQSLSSAGGKRLDKSASDELDKVWKAMDNKDWAGAAKILTALRDTDKDNPIVWFSLGYMHGTLGNHEIAIQQYRKAIDLQPNYVMAHYNIGINYDYLKEYAKAIASYKRAIALRPGYARAYYHTGLAHCSLKEYEEALAAFRKTVAIEPKNSAAHKAIGSVYRSLKQYRSALSAYRTALALRPNDAQIHCYMGWSYDYLKEYANAIVAYEKAIALDPNHAQTYLSMGVSYESMRQDSKAVAAYRKAVAVKSDYSLAYYRMGCVYERIANASDARRRLDVMLARHEAGKRIDRAAVTKYLAEYRRQQDLAVVSYSQYLRLEPTGTLATAARAAIRRIQK